MNSDGNSMNRHYEHPGRKMSKIQQNGSKTSNIRIKRKGAELTLSKMGGGQ